GDFGIYLDKTAEDLKKRGITDDESLYLETVRISLADLQKGLNRDAVTVSKSNQGMTVKAVLNGEVTCLLAVDTGAAVMVITRSIADRLEINPNDSLEDVQFTLADGSIIKSKVVKIKSVRVGNSTVHDVAAAVTDKPPGAGVDGLLGMSFLNNFNIKMDVANGKLILETIK
ncbi:MAG: retropepsin-like aspartic protease, partial [Candidatus Omnitrophota bacterium]